MEQIFRYLICSFFGLVTYLLGDSIHGCPLLSVFFNDCRVFFCSVSPTFRFEAYAYVVVRRCSLKEILTILVIIIGFMASTCVLFYPQETDRQKAVKIGCYLGDITAVIFVVEIIQKFFS